MSTTWTIGGTDIGGSSYDVLVVEESGLLDLAGNDQEEVSIRGRDLLSYTVKRRSYPQASLGLLVTGTDEADTLGNFANLRKLVSPTKGFQALTRSDVSSKRLLVRTTELAGNRVASEGATLVKTQWVMDRYPFWEDSSEQTTTYAGGSSGGTLANGGDVSCYPVFTITPTTSVTAIEFSVGSYSFKWAGSLASPSTLVVDTSAGTVKTGAGVSQIAGVDLITTPSLAKLRLEAGNNVIAKTATNYSLVITYRRRYE